MIKQIVFLVISPFNLRDYQRFGIELLEQNGFDVEVWDLTNILYPNLAKNYSPPDSIDWSGCKIFNDKNHALNKLRNLRPDTFIILLFHYNPGSYFIYKAISDNNAKYATFMANALPFVENNNKLQSFLFKFKGLRKEPMKKLINYVFRKAPFYCLGIKPVRLILAGGKESLKYPEPINGTTETLWAHTLDYDLYLEERNAHSAEQPIAVFIDEYVPFHPDHIYMGIKPPISARRYYPLLNKFFKLIEDQLGFEVIIAAHPRSHYKSQPDCFQGRTWIRGQTARLVKENRLVLTHSSTAVNFVNLFYKPVIFLTSYEMDKSSQGPLIRAMAKCYGKKPIFMDEDSNLDWESELRVNRFHYDNYREAYIKREGSEDLPFWQIVANRLKQGF